MEKEELKKWFIDNLKYCYQVTHLDYNDNIFYYYNKKIVRNLKICKLNNIEFKCDKISDICLFEKDVKNNILWCNYIYIWLTFQRDYDMDSNNVQTFIQNILLENSQLIDYTPKYKFFSNNFKKFNFYD